jgi:hypothetical protein
MIGGFVCAVTHPSGAAGVVGVAAVVHTGATIGPGLFISVMNMFGE